MSKSLEQLIRENLHLVFGERDSGKRRRAIADIWAEDSVFIDPDGQHAGRASVDAAVGKLLQRFPDFVFTEIGAVDAFHGIGRLAWGFGFPGSSPAVTGLDVVVAADGHIKALYTFLDRPKA